jgi:hypothetical protein
VSFTDASHAERDISNVSEIKTLRILFILLPPIMLTALASICFTADIYISILSRTSKIFVFFHICRPFSGFPDTMVKVPFACGALSGPIY